MSLLRTDTRYAIDTLIAIAKITSSPDRRETLLDEALGILRNGEDVSDTYGISDFMKKVVPVYSGEEPMKATDLYEMYCRHCLENGNMVAMRKVLFGAFKEAGYRFRTLHGYTVVDVRGART